MSDDNDDDDREYRGEMNEGLSRHFEQALAPLGREWTERLVDYWDVNPEGLLRAAGRPKPDHRRVDEDLDHRGRYYAIKRSDLDLLHQCAELVEKADSVGKVLSAPFRIVAKGLLLLMRYRRTRVELDVPQAFTLTALGEKEGNGSTAAELSAEIALPVSTVASALESMKTLRNAKGEVYPLVEQDGARWFALDF